ncbi:MAG TPA: MFS transporter [Rubrobacteraceae bacterium]|nr:MFS transporter [Rubrobacteraceae bacterium]
MSYAGRPPCDEGIIRSHRADAPCERTSGPWVLAAAIIASGMGFMDGTIVNVALPVIQRNLGATAVDALWIVESYALLLAALILVGGSLGDHYGRRRVFMIGIAIFTIASVWCGLSPSSESLIAARAVQGIGGALMIPGSLAIISSSFSDEDRGKAIGTWAGFSGVTAAIGPVVGGLLIDFVSWRAAFLINIPLALVALYICLRHIPESRDPDAARLDFVGATLATVGLGGLVFGLIEASNRSFGDPLVFIPLIVGVAALIGFIFAEWEVREPMMPLTLFRSRNFTGANLLTLLLYMGLGGALYFFPFVLIQVHGYSATAAGSAFLPFIVLTFLLSRWAGGLVPRIGPKIPLVIGPIIAAAGFFLFSLPGTGGTYWTTFFPAVVVMGLGMALVIAPLTTTALNSVSGRHSGLASGVNNAVSRTATLMAVALMGVFVFAAFSSTLDSRLDRLDVSQQAQAAMEERKIDLGAAQPPEGVDGATAAAIEEAVDESFVAGFRLAMYLAAGFALASALAAAIIVEGKGEKQAAGETEGEAAPA